jgi:D-hydroxyproline dehydrogenase subunit beta
MTDSNSILIVGAGILGLSHAYAAARRGLKVRVFERTATPLGASVRNFGQALVTGQPPGQMLDLARASRSMWADWARQRGLRPQAQRLVPVRPHRSRRATCSMRSARAARRSPAIACRIIARRPQWRHPVWLASSSHHRAALHGLDDQQVYSREAIPALIEYLRNALGVVFHFSTLVRDVEPGRGAHHGRQLQRGASDCVFGPRLPDPAGRAAWRRLNAAGLPPANAACAPAGGDLKLQHALLTGLSCVHYGAFADLPEAAAVQEPRFCATARHLDEHGIHLLISPTPYGDLIVGDSHDYSRRSFTFQRRTGG